MEQDNTNLEVRKGVGYYQALKGAQQINTYHTLARVEQNLIDPDRKYGLVFDEAALNPDTYSYSEEDPMLLKSKKSADLEEIQKAQQIKDQGYLKLNDGTIVPVFS